MIYIGIDISIDSTAVCIEKNDEVILYNYTDNKPTYKWNQIVKDNVNFRFVNYTYKNETEYSGKEMMLLLEADEVTDIILGDLMSVIDDDVKIGIEGYNYGGSNKNGTDVIVDIVTFSTLLRGKINKCRFGMVNKEIYIMSPKTIKMETCQITYGLQYALKKSKNVSRSPLGTAGGSFQKSDMLYAYLDYNMISPITDIVKTYKTELVSKNGKEVRKPVDDLIDSIWIKELVKHNL